MICYYGSTNYFDGEDTPPPLCPHGVNLDEAGCGQCVEDNRTDWDEFQPKPRRKLNRQEQLEGLADAGIDTWADYRDEK